MAITRLERSGYVDGRYVTHPFPIWLTSHEGRVLSVYNRDYQAMSDVYTIGTFAKVLNENDKVEEVLVNANFECDTGCGHASVDATLEVLEIKRQLDVRSEELRLAEAQRRREIEIEIERNRPVKGKTMIVFKGRKVPIGTTGVVAFVKDNGSVLLKKPEEWTNRNAPGVWVNPSNLKAV